MTPTPPPFASVSHAFPATRITIGAAVGIPLSSFCIIRRLYSISRVQAVAVTYDEVRQATESFPNHALTFPQKRRAILVDSLICVALPMIEMALGETRDFSESFMTLHCSQHMLSKVTALTSTKKSGASPLCTTPSWHIFSSLHGPS